MIEKLQQSERQLTREVETATDSKLQVLSGQKKSAEMSLSRLKDCKEFVEQSLKTGSHQQVLMSKKQMMEHMSHVTKEINVEEYNPIEKADVRLIKNNKMELSIGNIVCTTALQQCKVKKIDHHQITCEKERFSFPLSLELPNSSLLTVPLSSLSCSVVSTDNTPINTNTPLEFNFPRGITISPTSGQIYVADHYNHRIQVLNPDLTFSYSFGSKGSAEGQFSNPDFIAIDNQGLVYVSDCWNHCIQVFTSEGKYISQFGTFGSGPGQLHSPTGLVINNDLLYVVERNNSRVSIFTTDGQFVSSFGGYGNKKDQFNRPFGITLDNEGYLYICDLYNNKLVMY